MKNNLFNRMLFILPLAFAAVACQEYAYQVDEDLYNKDNQEMAVGLNDTYKEFDEGVHFVNVRFESNFWWNAQVRLLNETGDFETADWFRMTPTRNYGSREVTFDITRNIESGHDRAVEITFTSDDGVFSHTLTVLQKACKPFIETSSQSKSFSILGGAYEMYVTTSEQWDIEGLPDWVSVTSHAKTDNPKGKEIAVEFAVEEYAGTESSEDRRCEITFTAQGAQPQTLTFTQTRTAKCPESVAVEQTVTDLKAKWSAVAGAIYYDVIAYDTHGAELAVKRFTPPAGEQPEYECSIDDMAWNGYIGQIDVTVKACLSATVERESAKGAAIDHNLFATGSGDGTSAADGSVMKVATIRHFANIQKCLDTDKYLHYRQTADIDLSYYVDNTYTPIGSIAKPFIGSYDGNGFKFTDLKYDKSQSYTSIRFGLFGDVASAADPVTLIKNVSIKDFNIKIIDSNTGTALNAEANNFVAVGNLAGRVTGGARIENCTVSGDKGVISGSGNVSRTFFGGFVGVSEYALIKNCTISGMRAFNFLNAPASIGGIVGTSRSDNTWIENCVNRVQYFNFEGNTVSFGGIMARGIGTITGCANFTTMRIAHYTGGILAHSQYYTVGTTMNNSGMVTIENCVNYGNAEAVSGYVSALSYTSYNGAFGGIVGNFVTFGSACYIRKCANFGNVINHTYARTNSGEANGGFYAGGIVGNGQQVQITDCVNHGSISGQVRAQNSTRIFRIGGIFGFLNTNNGKIERCYSTGTINYTIAAGFDAENTVASGGFCGFYNKPGLALETSTLVNSFVLTGSAPALIGTGETVIDANSGFRADGVLKTAVTYNGWDAQVWSITEGSYPALLNIHPKN